MSGGKGGDQVIGYKYYLGLDFSWCHSPIDRVTAFFLDNREIYRGCFDEGSISIDKPELFGEIEGGIKGTVDLEIGDESQTANTYLTNVIDGDVPAYRGVTRTVWRGSNESGSGRACYVGNNPYLKRMSAEIQRIYKRTVDGVAVDQWQKDIAGVPLIDPDTRGLEFYSGDIQEQSLFVQMDLSSASNGYTGRNGNITGGGMGIASAKQAVIDSLEDIKQAIGPSGSLDIGVGYIRFTTGAQNNSSNNPSNVDVYEAPVPNYQGKSGPYDLPKRGWIMKEAATASDIEDLIGFVNDFVVVPDTVGQFPAAPLEPFQMFLDNATEAFASLSTSKLRGSVVYSALVSDETTLSELETLIESWNSLLTTNSGGDQPIKAVYGPNYSQYNSGGINTATDTLGTSGNAYVGVGMTYPVGTQRDGDWRISSGGWYLIADEAETSSNTYYQQTGPSAPYSVGERDLVDNPAGSPDGKLLSIPGENDKTWYYGPYMDSGIYAGNFDVSEHYQRNETGPTTLEVRRGTEYQPYNPWGNDNQKFSTDYNGFEVTDGPSPGIYLEGVCGGYVEMNPAHIIRECLTDQQWGLGLPEADIDETSFAAAAQTLYDERFGVSMVWDTETPIEDFVNAVLNHIDAVLYVSRSDGLWHLVLIRDDYDPDALDEYTDADVVEWSNVSIKSPAELVNSVTVKYNNRQLNGEASLTVHNLAQRQKLEKTISTTVNYPGIWQDTLATRVAQRDLITLSTSLIAGEVVLTRKAYDLAPGDVFKLTSSRYNLSGEVMRVVEVNVGDGRQNSVRVKFTQDKYNFDYSDSTDLVSPPDPAFTDPGATEPEVVDDRLVVEGPYYLFVQNVGEVAAEEIETNEIDIGYGFVSAVAPTTSSVYARIYYDDGAGYILGNQVPYGPSATVGDDINEQADSTTLTVSNLKFSEDISANDLIQINDEIMRVVSVDSSTQLTVARGALDTVPAFHQETDPIFFISNSNGIIDNGYVASDTVDVKLLDSTNRDQLDPLVAPVDTITMDSRITRPYPVGQLQLDGTYRGVWDTSTGNTIEATWVHRDRTLQTASTPPVHVDSSVGPETNVNYTISAVAYDYEGNEISISGDLFSVDKNQNTSHTITPSDNTADSEGTIPWSAVGVQVLTTREDSTSVTYDNWQTPEVLAYTIAGVEDFADAYESSWVDINVLSGNWQEYDRENNVASDGDSVGYMENIKETFT